MAHAAARSRNRYFAAQYRRLAARRGTSRAAVAVGHRLWVTIYHLLQRGTEYQDLGPHHFEERDRDAVVRTLIHRWEGLGCQVAVPSPTAA